MRSLTVRPICRVRGIVDSSFYITPLEPRTTCGEMLGVSSCNRAPFRKSLRLIRQTVPKSKSRVRSMGNLFKTVTHTDST